MNPSPMNWIPQEMTTAGPHGSVGEKNLPLNLKPISFCAAKFSYRDASSSGLSAEVLSSNGSNCACKDSTLRLSSRTEIGLGNARNLPDVSVSNARPRYVVDFIAALPLPSEDQAPLKPLITPSFDPNNVIQDNIRWDEFDNYNSKGCPEFPNNDAVMQLETASFQNFVLGKTIEKNESIFPKKKISTTEAFSSCLDAGTKAPEIRSHIQTRRKHSPPRPAVDVSKKKSISLNWSRGSSGVEGIISFRLKGISEHGQGGPNAISRRAWEANVSRCNGQSLEDGQVSASHVRSTTTDWQTSASDRQFSSLEHQSLEDRQISPEDCQPLLMDCLPPVSGQMSDLNRQSSTKNRQSSTDACQLPSVNSQSAAPRWPSPGRLALSRVLLTFVLLTALKFQATSAKIRSRDDSDPVSNIRHVLPELELGNNSVTDVRFNEGSTAFLPCRFPTFPRHHENRVSWIRRWDWHILTAGVFTYTNDDRFVVLHKDGTNDWTLQIKFLQTQDNGTYECQVHTGSGFMSQFVNLFVITPRAAILEPREFTIETGQDFSLTCVIQQSLEPPVYVMWLHGGVPVNYAPDRPRLNVELIVKGSTSRSILSVKNAKYSDSGNYTCTAPNAINAWVLVYVTQGDTVAAVQRRQPNSSRTVAPEIDGAPALPSMTNAAVPLINFFVIPFFSILTRYSSVFLETDFHPDARDCHLHFARSKIMSSAADEGTSLTLPEFRDRKSASRFQYQKLGCEPSFIFSSQCEGRRNFGNRLKFLIRGKSVEFRKIDLIFIACVYFIALQLITSLLLELRSEVQLKQQQRSPSSFYLSQINSSSLTDAKRTANTQVSESVPCFNLIESEKSSR